MKIKPAHSIAAAAALLLLLSPQLGEAKDIKVGFISAFTGVFSSFGQQQKEGAVIALEEFNYTAGGSKINVTYEDDQLDNELAVTKAKKLVEQDKIEILTGLVSGDEGLSVGDYMKDKNIPVIPMYSASEDMTMRSFYPMIVRVTWTGAQSMDVFGYWLAKTKGWKKIYSIGQDYSFPYNQGGGFKRGFFRGGGEEVTTVWHPAGTTSDFSSIIAAIPTDKGYDAVLYNGAGGDAVNFVKQYVELGMLKKIPLIGGSNAFEKPDVESMPAEIVGALSAHHTADDLATPAWTKFKETYNKRWNHDPSAASEFAYSSMRMILRALDARKGDTTDRQALVNAMIQVDMSDDPRGPVKVDPQFHSAIENVYIREVAKDDKDQLYNKGLTTTKDVGQFGPYDSQLYLRQPPDTGKHPPDKRSAFAPELLQAESQYQFLPFGQ
jgi:branched-chain amino acid transport system substrate-binding protein